MNKVRVLFNRGSGDNCPPSSVAAPSLPIDEGENDLAALWISDLSSSVAADGISNAKNGGGRESSVPIGLMSIASHPPEKLDVQSFNGFIDAQNPQLYPHHQQHQQGFMNFADFTMRP